MKTKFYLFSVLCFLLFGKNLAQPAFSPTVPVLTPDGCFDNVFDAHGNKYSLYNLQTQPSNQNFLLPAYTIDAGYFRLYISSSTIFFTNPAAANVLKQVFKDISGLVVGHAPLNAANNSAQINIFVETGSTNLLASFSSFYSFPLNPTNPNQGYIDGMIHKYITTGVDPYSTLPITFTNTSAAFNLANFYHGILFINNTPNLPPLFANWNLALNNYASTGEFDLYSTLLHEITHGLGFQSLIRLQNQSVVSVFGPQNQYYSRYDKYLHGMSGAKLITSTSPCENYDASCTSNYTAVANSTILSTNYTQTTNCLATASYSSPLLNLNVYTPSQFVNTSSLSHFNDRCPTPSASLTGITCSITSTDGNNSFFVMTPYSNQGFCGSKRFLQDAEYYALCDQGYSLYSSYGPSTTSVVITGTSSIRPYNVSCTNSNNIFGVNDGIANGVFTFTTSASSYSLPISTLVNNDIGSGLSINCVDVVYSNNINNASVSVVNNSVVVSANIGSGLVIIKYLPTDGISTGLCTYAYIYFTSNGCNPVTNCNMIQNSGFESIIGNQLCGPINTQTGPLPNCWVSHSDFPSIVTNSCLTGGVYNLGVNTIGSNSTPVSSFNGNGNNHALVLRMIPAYQNYNEVIKSTLSGPLINGGVYKIRLVAQNPSSNLNSFNNQNTPVILTIASAPNIFVTNTGNYPGNLNILTSFTIPAANTWSVSQITFTFTSQGQIPHNAIFIGINQLSIASLQPPNSLTCYIDEVNLVPSPSPDFTLQSTMCSNQSYLDLNSATSQPGVGYFSGYGVSFNNGTYNFNFNQNLPPGSYFVAYTYTNANCSNTIFEPISISTNTNLLSLSGATLCSTPYTISLSSLLTNSNYLNGSTFYLNGTLTNSIVTLTPNNSYTVNVTNFTPSLNLCNQYNSSVIQVGTYPSTLILNPNFSPTVCSGQTLNVSCFTGSNSNCSWSPSLIIGCSGVGTCTSTTIYTVTTYDYPACPFTGTIDVSVFNLNSASLCVSSGSFDLNQLLTLPTYSANLNYSINGQPSSSVFSFNSPGTYTVAVTSPTSLCNSIITNTIEIYGIPNPPTVTPNNNVICQGNSITLTISATPSPGNFTIVPTNYSSFGSIAANSYSFLTNSSGTYSVYSQNGTCLSNNSATFEVIIDPVTCSCTQSCSATLAGSINVSPAPFLSYCVTNDLYINGAITFSVSEFKISPGVKIHINTGGTLNIVGSHLFACADMWDGILVQGSGALKMFSASNGTTTLIEDAVTAIYVYPTTVPHPFAAISGEKIVALEEVTFNRNLTGLKVELFSNPYTNNPFKIVGCLFTSRAIPTGSLTWPLTNTIKLSSSGNTSPLQTPWLDTWTYPSATLKTPHNGQYPANALHFWAVGHSVSSPGTVSQYTSITVGEGGINNFNLFDNHLNGIYCNRSSITIVNAVFQNPRALCRPVSQPICDQNGGTGVVAVCPWTDDNPARHKIEVIPAVIGNSVFPNYFYDMTKAVVVENYLFTDVSRNKIYSYSNNKGWTPSIGWNTCWNTMSPLNIWLCNPPNFGNIGVDITSNSFQYLFCEENELYNIRNGIIFTATEGLTDFTTNGTFGRYIGQVSISRNLFGHNPGTAHGFEYTQQAILLQDPISAPGYTPNIATMPAVTPSLVINDNLINDCYNGIEVNSFYGTPVNVVSNSITLINDHTGTNPPQYGIGAFQVQDCRIHKNTIIGNGLTSQTVAAIYTSMNTQLSIRCNTTDNTHVGFAFNSAQTVTHFEDNSMQNQSVGLLLANAAILTATNSALGSTTRPTNNRWLGVWGPNNTTPPFKTYTDFNTSAQNGKLYVEYFNPIMDPDGNGGTIQLPYQDNYWHTGGPPNATVTLFSSIPVDGTPSCRIDFDNELCMGCKTVSQNNNLTDSLVKKAIEEIASDSLSLTSAMSDNQYIAKTMGLRTLFTDSTIAGGSSLLSGFTTSLQATSIAQCVNIEKNLASGNYATANSINNSFPPIHPIEQHNKLYYDLVLKHFNQTFGAMDSIQLDSLTKMCPFKDGSIVYLARALFNKRFNTSRRYIDVCTPSLTYKKNKKDDAFLGQLVPNPNDGSFAIQLESETNEQMVLSIYDITGRLMQEQQVPLNTKDIKVDSRLNNGIYLIKLISHEGVYSYKLIIQN